MTLEIWHNPRCSKSRQTLALIEEAGADHVVRRYLDEPPTAEELDAALSALGREPWEVARTGEPVAEQVGLRDLPHDRSRWIEVMVAPPVLIERPIVLDGAGRAVLGRPPEAVESLLAR